MVPSSREVDVSQAHRGCPCADGEAVGVSTIAFDTSAARPQAIPTEELKAEETV